MRNLLVNGGIALVILALLGGIGAGLMSLAERRPEKAPTDEVEGPAGPPPIVVDPATLDMARRQKAGELVQTGEAERTRLNARMAYFAPLARGHAAEWLGLSIRRGVVQRFRDWERDARREHADATLGEGDATRGVVELERLFGQHPPPVAVVGHIDETDAAAMRPLYHRHRVLMFPLTAGTDEIVHDGQIYTVGYDEAYYAWSVLELARRQRIERVIIVDDGTPHGMRMADLLFADAHKLEMIVDTATSIEPRADVGARLAEVINVGHPHAVVLVTRDPATALAWVTKLEAKGNRLPVFLTDGAATSDFADRCGDTRFPVYVASAFDPRAERAADFVAAYKQAHGAEPDQWAALAYDMAGLFFTAIDPKDELFEVAAFERHIRTVFTASSPYPGVTGPIHFDRVGRAHAREVLLLRFQEGHYRRVREQLTPDERAEIAARPAAPMPTEEQKVTDGPLPEPEAGPMGAPQIKRQPPAGPLWTSTIDDALDAATQLERPIAVQFVSRHPDCQKIATSWTSDAVAAVAGDWVFLRLDLDAQPHIAEAYELGQPPAVGIWDKRGCVAATLTPGPLEPDDLAALLKKHLPAVQQQMADGDRLIGQTYSRSTRRADVYRTIGQFFLERKGWIGAATYLRTARAMLRRDGRRDEAAQLTAPILQAHLAADHLDDAESLARRWLAQRPESREHRAFARYALGYCAVRDGRLDEAREAFAALAGEKGPAEEYHERAREVFRLYARKPLD